MSWHEQVPENTTSNNASWDFLSPSDDASKTSSWDFLPPSDDASKTSSWTPQSSSAAAPGMASWAWNTPSPIKSASWTFAEQKRKATPASWSDTPPLIHPATSVPSWVDVTVGPPRIRNSWSDKPVHQKRYRDPTVPYTIDDQINDMLDAYEAGDPSMDHIDQQALLAKISLDEKKAATRSTVDGIEKSFVSFFLMVGGIFNAFRDSMPTVFPAAFFGEEVYAKAQQTGNEINDEITRFIADGKARGVTEQLLRALASYGDHDPQLSNMRRAFAKADARDKHKSEKQLVDEQQGNFGGVVADVPPEINLHHYPPKLAQLFDYGMKSFMFSGDISIGSFITRTEVGFIPLVQTLRPNVGFILHLMNFLPTISTPSEMLGFLAKKAAHWVDPNNEHLLPLFDSVFSAVQPVLQPVLSFIATLLNLIKPAMKLLLDRAHIVSAFTDRLLKYVMILAGMIWSLFAAIVHFVVKLVLAIVQLVVQVVLSIYASPWVGELVNLILTFVASLV